MVAIISFSGALMALNDRTFADAAEALYNIKRETGLELNVVKAQLFTHDNVLVGAFLSTDQHALLREAANDQARYEGRKWASQVVYPSKRKSA